MAEHPATDRTTGVGAFPCCRHGKILLGCDDDDCPEQNAYLAVQEAAVRAYEEQLRDNVRAALGLGEPDTTGNDMYGEGQR